MLSLTTGIARSESEMEVKHEVVSELRLQLRLQPVLLLRRLIAANGAKPPGRLWRHLLPIYMRRAGWSARVQL